MIILAGDIGGTNSRLAMFDASLNKLIERDFQNKNYSGLAPIIAEFLQMAKGKPDRACFGVAGPVSKGKVLLTNIGWELDERDLAFEFKIERVRLINDMMAHAEGIEVLLPDQVTTLKPGEDMEGNRCIIAAGTGLGEGGLAWDRNRWVPFASEGGHTDFAPTDEQQDELLRWMRKRHNNSVCVEHIVSGPGLKSLYEFMCEGQPNLKGKLPAGKDGSKDITNAVETSELARATVELFTKLYLIEAGNWTLKTIALGGCYMGGGIAITIQPFLRRSDLHKYYWTKGHPDMCENLKKIPIRLILSDKNGLQGAANAARKL
jgi:glucokinase